MNEELIAPCGMNCSICNAHYRKKNTCPGCRKINIRTSTTRLHCSIRDCSILKDRKWMYCSDTCDFYPCKRLKSLDERYKKKYHMSMIENHECIKKEGVRMFLEKEQEKWECPECGGIITCHGGMCLTCGFEKYKN